jgi:non-ribosomal peptide synthetase component F
MIFTIHLFPMLQHVKGKPLDNCSIYLLDSNTQQLVAEGDVGEIYVAGSHLCSGYVNQREMQRFVVNPIDKQNKSRILRFTTQL